MKGIRVIKIKLSVKICSIRVIRVPIVIKLGHSEKNGFHLVIEIDLHSSFGYHKPPFIDEGFIFFHQLGILVQTQPYASGKK